LVNASLTLVPAVARHTSIRLWGDNITREKYYVFELPVAGGAGNLAILAPLARLGSSLG
jgi:hypothetical protein